MPAPEISVLESDRGEIPQAIETFQQAIATTDTYAETRHNLALTMLQMPNQRALLPDIIHNFERAIEIDPRFYRSYLSLADLYQQLGDPEKSAFYHAKATALMTPAP